MRGIQKKMIVVRTENNPYFEEAHFLLKPDADSRNSGDILTEANRIIEESMYPYTVRRKRGSLNCLIRYALLFGAGLIAGGGLIALILLI